ncbi:DJ-1/PfpI family protein [Streptomonospora nanhaiensis]|uniref:Transcriptional regulator GlxA family with amidase domain n=1 Tax=Streptomonospora nanhaiensis TaxID=1323731 RepID=A0A853BNN4_9ACTN|nr:DJ-1/PfpI family protein [Streptomonospora nanhaiensis]MBV2361942.1 DJ-1/PfpI family protein [Streptomonospora nanhaiensis]MBX9390918.1 DJ-1/PfpI family protein [Streptomonospora nanhaiensis]NYI96236.1 transcriptional regulator GlxA family with amidase domain [Streptomonospora nanhaiensis]
MTLRVQAVLYDGVEDQDLVGPLGALDVVDDVRTTFVTLGGPGTVTTSFGMEVRAGAALDPARADLVVVPGGGYGAGSAVDRQVRSGALPRALAEAARPGLIMAGVCTGTLLLSAAGLTAGRPCTTHHAATQDLAAQGAEVVAGRVVDDGDLVTCGGVTSGIDLGLWLVERLYGAQAALLAEQILEHERRGTVWRRPAARGGEEAAEEAPAVPA